MIRINLLPVRQERKRETIQQQLVAAAGVLLLTLFGCVTWWKLKTTDAEDRAAQVEAKKQELAQLDKIIGEVNEFTNKKKELEDKLAIIQQLKKGKTGPVRALDDLATEIPKRVWLLSMAEKGGTITFDGVAVDHEDVSAFMKSLQKSKYFKNVVLGYSTAKGDKRNVLYSFKITCNVNYSA